MYVRTYVRMYADLFMLWVIDVQISTSTRPHQGRHSNLVRLHHLLPALQLLEPHQILLQGSQPIGIIACQHPTVLVVSNW